MEPITDEERDALLARQILDNQRRMQDGVVGYEQLVDGGWSWNDVRRSERRKELVRVHPRVEVDHTGPLTSPQRAWAAVLHAAPAALCLASAWDLSAPGPVHLAIDSTRRIARLKDVEYHPVAGLARRIRPHTNPPRLTFEENLLLAIRLAKDEEEIVALLAAHVGRRGLTAASLRQVVGRQRRLSRRLLLLRLLDDIENGTESVLEHGYLTRVERPHRLPVPVRQAVSRVGGRVERRDIEYPGFDLVIELDGQLNHDSWRAGNRDAARDLADLTKGRIVLRLRWRQVMVESCLTAGAVGGILQRRGWDGAPVPCSPSCAVASLGSGSATVIG